ncbi:MAG: HAD family hydrolase [Clostridiales bacterium GWF2_36_10]|nr:MAG: HAD family hydrolase [Clostridiales bacterium GWF2_36_10]HAN21369.1 HAD family hydrolase [Clostridiales bacterium]
MLINKEERLRNTELFVLDMDGTIYLGERVFPDAVEFIKKAKAANKKIIYFTNNASKNTEIYYDKLIKMGFSAERSEILSSGDVTARYLKKHHPGEPVYLVGTPALEQSFATYGIEISEKAKIVVSSFDTTLTYKKLEVACDLIRNGAIFYSTHPDFNCPTENGFIPDSGAICALITASTGKVPKYFGKPYKETADLISELSGIPFNKTAIVGDRLYTDIALGKNNGILSILVLTGETKLEDINDKNAPDFCLQKISEIIPFFA